VSLFERIFGPSRHEKFLEAELARAHAENQRLWCALTGGRVRPSAGPAPDQPGPSGLQPGPDPAPAGPKAKPFVPRRTMHQVQTALEIQSRRTVAQAEELRKQGILSNEKAIATRQVAEAFQKQADAANQRLLTLGEEGSAPHPTELADPVEEAFEAFGEN
jgi:hypothetical protein